MEIENTTDILRMINTFLTPISLFLSMFLVGYAFRAWKQAKEAKQRNQIVALALFGVGLVFLIESIVLLFVYFVIYTSNNRELVNFASNSRLLITNLLTIITSVLMLKIYRTK